MLSSTFGAFTTARLGIYVSQMGLNVTGNNIANINTPGYTRQQLDQISFHTGGSDRYQSTMTSRVGSGALAVGVSQIRDPYLDIRYRTELSSVGAMDSKLTGLNDLQAILDEVGDGDDDQGLIHAQFSDLLEKLQNLTTNTNQDDFDTQVRESASALVDLLNSYSNQLDQVYDNTVDKLNQSVSDVNDLLTQIRDLNDRIRRSDIHGDDALELRDQRNSLIDELSSYMKIDVVYSSEEVSPNIFVEKLTIRLGNANPQATDTENTTLVDGIYAAQLSVSPERLNPNFDPDNNPGTGLNFPYFTEDGGVTSDPNEATLTYDVTVSSLADSKGNVQNGSQATALDDNDLFGSLQSIRELLTESGEFSTQNTVDAIDENAAIKRGIPYYQKSLDLLAKTFADAFNKANTGYMVNEKGEYLNQAGNTIQDAAGNTLTNTMDLSDDQMNILKGQGQLLGGPLFSSGGDETEGITAGNISISDSWANRDVKLVASFVKPTGQDSIPTTAHDNITHMVNLMDKDLTYDPTELVNGAVSDDMFVGSFQEMLVNISAVLGNDARSTTTMLNTYYNSAVELETSRDSVSAVDLNDEATGLIQYQKSYSAACRLMTTIDEALDKLINGTGTVGL
ncbi:MAG: flagellar hook-associated protein FlgK [Acutalibacter sp.]|jgi:flagellar hook-associated protein 1 FlgK